jgi:hypothetical protein
MGCDAMCIHYRFFYSSVRASDYTATVIERLMNCNWELGGN